MLRPIAIMMKIVIVTAVSTLGNDPKTGMSGSDSL
jgi:hypothetical protein